MRARNIKPGAFDDEAIGSLSNGAFKLFVGMWCIADREGRLKRSPTRWSAQVFPYNADATPERVGEWLSEIENARDDNGGALVISYTVEGIRYISVCGFVKHQSPHHRENPSTIPSPNSQDFAAQGDAPSRTQAGPSPRQAQARQVPAALIPDSGILNPECGTLIADEDGGEPAITVRVSITYPCKGDKEWALTEAKAAEYRALHGDVIDVDHELRKARQWLIDNPDKRKTPRGMTRFLNSWLSRAAEQKEDKRDGGAEKESFGYG